METKDKDAGGGKPENNKEVMCVNEMELPLHGVKVVDISMFMAGPMCGRALGEWGADVIKVEPPEGDAFRYAGAGMFSKDENMNIMYQINNACKRHISLDLKKPEAKDVLKKLLADADVMITNFRTPALTKLGLRYEDLCNEFPKLIVAQLTGYGEKGSDCDAPGYDSVAFFARTGLMTDLVEKGATPIISSGGIGDTVASIVLCSGILAALTRQQRSGKGCKVSSSLLSAGLYVLGLPIAAAQEPFYSRFPKGGTRMDNMMPTNSIFKCSDDEWMFIAVPNPAGEWTKLATALGRPDWAESTEMASPIYLAINHEKIITEMDKIMITKSSFEWEGIFKENDVPHQRLKHIYEQLDDPQVQENGYVFNQKFQNGESYKLVSNPIQFSDVPERELPPPGKIGQDTIEILKSLGYSQNEIDSFLNSKVARYTPA